MSASNIKMIKTISWLTAYQLVHYHHRESRKENDSEYSHNIMIITVLWKIGLKC